MYVVYMCCLGGIYRQLSEIIKCVKVSCSLKPSTNNF